MQSFHEVSQLRIINDTYQDFEVLAPGRRVVVVVFFSCYFFRFTLTIVQTHVLSGRGTVRDTTWHHDSTADLGLALDRNYNLTRGSASSEREKTTLLPGRAIITKPRWSACQRRSLLDRNNDG